MSNLTDDAGAFYAAQRPKVIETVINTMAVSTDWTVLGNDTTTLANSALCVRGAGSTSFAKVNGAGNTVYAGVYKTVALDLSTVDPRRNLVCYVYLSAITDVIAVNMKLGTSASHLMTWSVLVADLAAGWNRVSVPIYEITGSTGNGWTPATVAYAQVNVEFSSEEKALAGILVNYWSIEPGQIVT